VLTTSNGTPLSGQPLTLTLGTGTGTVSCSANSDSTGTTKCSVTPTSLPLGQVPVTVSFAGNANYAAATTTAQTLLYTYLPQGAFVIGDKSAVVNGSVTFSGPQWARDNSLTGGGAPASFKGFASTPSSTVPVCGGTWTTGPGNSAGAPTNVPSYVAVIVSSNVAKSGSTISGNIKAIAIVKTDAGGVGTGTVVAILPCAN
jgi:hypothetical protein